MQKGRITKYQPFPPVDLPDRQWPSRTITTAPIWCSVDLRDGNQALPIPMGVEEKLEMFQLLTRVGFKEIEVGFPASSQTEYEFIRRLIEEDLVPDDVWLQVLVQAREELIGRTIESLHGAKKAIIHLYNSTSPLQRRVVFGLDKPDITNIAVRGTQLVKELLPTLTGTQVMFQYSPESFSSTEVDFALEICEAVADVWQPTLENKIILNLPDTVEAAGANIYADQIEWLCRHLRNRETAIISVHTHNDRGTGVAATELGLLAGAERVEGTLFGNGERTGNVDIVTVALNMYTQGIDPGLDFSDIDAIRAVCERCTRMEVPMRQPYAGDLVFTAFSGSHQDAINKGMMAQDPTPGALWQVPYLPIDPKDLGRTYEAIIRINSQSGKGGVAYVLGAEFGLHLPKAMHIEFGKVIKNLADETGDEISSSQLFEAFEKEYLSLYEPFKLETLQVEGLAGQDGDQAVACHASLVVEGIERHVSGRGKDAVDAFVQALNQNDVIGFNVLSQAQHALSRSVEVQEAAYVHIQNEQGQQFFGAGIDNDKDIAAAKAVLSALNRSMRLVHAMQL